MDAHVRKRLDFGISPEHKPKRSDGTVAAARACPCSLVENYRVNTKGALRDFYKGLLGR